MKAVPRKVVHDERGMTLVELLVYVILLAVVLGLVATFFIRSIAVQKTVITTGQANNTAQVAFSELSRAVRNAGPSGVKADGNLLVLFTGGGPEESTSWKCRAWYYVAPVAPQTSGRLYSTTKPKDTKIVPVASSFAAGTPSGWTLAIDGVVPTNATTSIFSGGTTAGVTASMVVTRTGKPTDIDAVAMTTTVLPRPQPPVTVAGASPNGGCF